MQGPSCGNFYARNELSRKAVRIKRAVAAATFEHPVSGPPYHLQQIKIPAFSTSSSVMAARRRSYIRIVCGTE